MILQIIQIKLVDEWKLPRKHTTDDFLHILHNSAHLISNLYAPCDTIFEEHFIYTLIKHESAWNRDSKTGISREWEGENERERPTQRPKDEVKRDEETDRQTNWVLHIEVECIW